jgi:hypothetical protein
MCYFVIDTLLNQQVFFYPHLHPFVMALAFIFKKLKRVESKERKKERRKKKKKKKKTCYKKLSFITCLTCF